MRGATDVPATKDISIPEVPNRPPSGSSAMGAGTGTPAAAARSIRANSSSIGTSDTDPFGSRLSTQLPLSPPTSQVSREAPPGIGRISMFPGSSPFSTRTLERPAVNSSSTGLSLVVRWMSQTEEETDVGREPFQAQVPDAGRRGERCRTGASWCDGGDGVAEQGAQRAASGDAEGSAPPAPGWQQALPREQAGAARLLARRCGSR